MLSNVTTVLSVTKHVDYAGGESSVTIFIVILFIITAFILGFIVGQLKAYFKIYLEKTVRDRKPTSPSTKSNKKKSEVSLSNLSYDQKYTKMIESTIATVSGRSKKSRDLSKSDRNSKLFQKSKEGKWIKLINVPNKAPKSEDTLKSNISKENTSIKDTKFKKTLSNESVKKSGRNRYRSNDQPIKYLLDVPKIPKQKTKKTTKKGSGKGLFTEDTLTWKHIIQENIKVNKKGSKSGKYRSKSDKSDSAKFGRFKTAKSEIKKTPKANLKIKNK